jgi:DNA processing protein
VAYEIFQLRPEQFPPELAEIPQAPTELYAAGQLPWLNGKYQYLTVVGSRKFTHYGRDACEKLIAGLAGYPIVIVSGLAIGIDTIAHQAALKAGLLTLAMPGSGLAPTVIHPSSNRQLAEEIVASGGALLAEFPPNYPAGLHTFPRRNRLMAGLARATLIIEAGEKSGTLITARLATEYNRDVLAVPGSIYSTASAGANWLIKQGATPITSSEDILRALNFDMEKEQTKKQQELFADLSPGEQKIIELISYEPLTRDELILALDLPAGETSSLLMTMEIKGLIKEELGEIRLG